MMQDFRFGAVKDSKFVMSFAITSDTHFTNSWINENFLGSLADAKELDPNLTAVIQLGDLSDNGIALNADGSINYAKSDLDNYYDWRDSFEYKNSKGERVKWEPNPLGAMRGDVWSFPTLAGKLYKNEKTDHPTQKPVKLLEDFDIAVYTGHELCDVPQELLDRINYIKTGSFKEELKTTVKPFVGSTNQEFRRLR